MGLLLLLCVVAGSRGHSGKSYSVRASEGWLVFLHLDPYQYTGAKLRTTSWAATWKLALHCEFFLFFWNSISSRLTALLFGNVLGRVGGFLLVDLVCFTVGKLSARWVPPWKRSATMFHVSMPKLYKKQRNGIKEIFAIWKCFHRLASLVMAFSASVDTGMHKVFSVHNKKVKL